MAASDEAGVYVVGNQSGSQFFVMGHSEYDIDTLAKEYFRDVDKGLNPEVPVNYFEDDDPTKQPTMRWARPWHVDLFQLAELLCISDNALYFK